MKRYRLFLALIMLTVMGCSAVQVGIENTPTPVLFGPTATQPPTATPAVAMPSATSPAAQPATNTPIPAATDTAVPPTLPATATALPPTAAVPSLTPVNPDSIPYLDDSSTATGLIQSLFNALNRREYSRAYGYWAQTNSPNGVATFDQFQQGYADTQSIQVKIGPVSHDEGAGQIYFSIGVVLKATKRDGTTQTYTACYNMHLANPGMQTQPPFTPMLIEDGKAGVAPAGSSDASLLLHSCDGIARAAQPFATAPVTNTQDITTANYLDDRTGPVEVLSSMFNAINRHEYDRAYSYWESGGQVPSFDQFQSGYANTASVVLTTGTPIPGNAAGSIYYNLPAVIVAKTSSGATQTFYGCYQMHLGRPANQTVPPFHPLAIQMATVKSAANSADHAALLKTACTTQ